MNETLLNIANRFDIRNRITEVEPLGAGFINDTYIARTDHPSEKYILQKKNKNIFPEVEAMMENILAVTDHIRKKIEAYGGDPEREVMTVVKTLEGHPYFLDDDGEYWTVSRYIEGSVTYEKADSAHLAYKGGKGIGRFQSILADFEGTLAETIKGFHNIRHRFEQWDNSLNKDAVGRKAEVAEEIEWIESRREEMMRFWNLVEDGIIPTRVTHNDTKISNILFDSAGDVLCVIDLDTVMSSTSLNDFGDAIRSYANTGAEDDVDLGNVGVDLEMFEAYTKGYLEERNSTLLKVEKEHLAFAALYITFEQVLRFLMDYLDGDTYYKTAYPQHNLVRARAQYKLLKSMEENYEKMCKIVNSLAN